jgi:transcriptional regulator with XRE-family HTH domain
VPFPLEELISKAPAAAREAYLERSAAFEAGDLVRAMRDKSGLTQKGLAEKIGTSQAHLSEIERGNGLQGPTFSMLRRIADACGMELRIDFQPACLAQMVDNVEGKERAAAAEGLGAPEHDVSRALTIARERALAALQPGNLARLFRSGAQGVYDFTIWLHNMPNV